MARLIKQNCCGLCARVCFHIRCLFPHKKYTIFSLSITLSDFQSEAYAFKKKKNAHTLIHSRHSYYVNQLLQEMYFTPQ